MSLQRDLREPWHLRKEISIGTIILLISGLLTGAKAFSDINNDIQTLKESKEETTEHLKLMSSKQEQLRLEIKQDMNQLDRKIDRVLDIVIDNQASVRQVEKANGVTR